MRVFLMGKREKMSMPLAIGRISDRGLWKARTVCMIYSPVTRPCIPGGYNGVFKPKLLVVAYAPSQNPNN